MRSCGIKDRTSVPLPDSNRSLPGSARSFLIPSTGSPFITPSTLTYSVATSRISSPPADLLYRQADDRFGMARTGGDHGVRAGRLARSRRLAAWARVRGQARGDAWADRRRDPSPSGGCHRTHLFPCGAHARAHQRHLSDAPAGHVPARPGRRSRGAPGVHRGLLPSPAASSAAGGGRGDRAGVRSRAPPAGDKSAAQEPARAGLAGALLFFYSDGLLAWNRVVKPVPRGGLGNIVLYHAGQALLVLSLVS